MPLAAARAAALHGENVKLTAITTLTIICDKYLIYFVREDARRMAIITNWHMMRPDATFANYPAAMAGCHLAMRCAPLAWWPGIRIFNDTIIAHVICISITAGVLSLHPWWAGRAAHFRACQPLQQQQHAQAL